MFRTVYSTFPNKFHGRRRENLLRSVGSKNCKPITLLDNQLDKTGSRWLDKQLDYRILVRIGWAVDLGVRVYIIKQELRNIASEINFHVTHQGVLLTADTEQR